MQNKEISEKSFQERFVKELQEYRWEAPESLNGNTHKVTVRDLIDHWRGELNRINADQLEGVPLTDNEFQQVLSKVKQISNSYESSKILAMEESKGKIDGIYRDKNENITRNQITLTIFKKAEISGGDSSYKIAREVVSSNNNRFDIVLLINGLPLINVEQKRTDKTVEEAFGQFKRYYRDGEYSYNFMAFSQMMVIVSEIDTRYFATPKSYDDFNLSFVFRWSDKANKPITHWKEVIQYFLMIPMVHQMVGDYLVIDEAKEEENRRHMLMRPYQVYALQAVEGAAFGWDNEEKIPHGGFVWHTTGSGKTITSFKTALFLSTRAGFDKVLFLVDRRELDSRTTENFKAYAAYESVSVDNTKHTYNLKRQLFAEKRGIIVTTTFKLNSLVEELEESENYKIADKKIVFIIDEAHRTTMGQMMGRIKNYFKKNGLFYGFTGTPLFDENKISGMVNSKSELIDTTEKLFGPMLHQYTIEEAISDGNVLGFHVDYMNTGEFQSYEELREKLAAKIKEEKPELSDREIQRIVVNWDPAELELKAKEKGILVYHDETHIPRVVEEILKYWDTQSQNRKFNAILTAAYKNRVIEYYNEFKKQMEEKNFHINIAMTFSFGNENDPENTPPQVIEEMFLDYSKFTGIEFAMGDKRRGESAYFEDIVERATRGGSGRNPKNIDLLIVADQLLTGYDSKLLNTLYVDRSLELQGLIQAYSRTNRVYGKDKEFGSIINFQYPALTKKTVDIALKLYGSGGKSSKAIVEKYPTAVDQFLVAVREMRKTLEDPTKWIEIKEDEEEKQLFLKSYRDAAEQLNFVTQYYQYKWDDEAFGIDEHNWLHYEGAYKNLRDKMDDEFPPGPVIEPLSGETGLQGTDIIDASHIIRLIGEKVNTENDSQSVDSESLRIIYEQIQELSDRGEYEQSLLLKKFVDQELVPGHIPSSLHFDEAYALWKQQLKEKEIEDFSENWGVVPEIVKDSVEEYSVSEPEIIPFFDEIVQSLDYDKAKNKSNSTRLNHIISLKKEVKEWIAGINERFK